jgi:hypothetical protein
MRTNDVAVLDRIAQLNGLRSRHEVRAGQDLVVPESDVLAGVSVSNAVASRGARLANAYAQAAAQQATRDNAVTVTVSGIASLPTGEWVFRRNVTAESGERDRSVRLNVTGESG